MLPEAQAKDNLFIRQDNGVQLFYSIKHQGITYEILQNHQSKNPKVWWVFARKDSATIVMNHPPINACLYPELAKEGDLWVEDFDKKSLEYWMESLLAYLKEGFNPFSNRRSFK